MVVIRLEKLAEWDVISLAKLAEVLVKAPLISLAICAELEIRVLLFKVDISPVFVVIRLEKLAEWDVISLAKLAEVLVKAPLISLAI